MICSFEYQPPLVPSFNTTVQNRVSRASLMLSTGRGRRIMVPKEIIFSFTWNSVVDSMFIVGEFDRGTKFHGLALAPAPKSRVRFHVPSLRAARIFCDYKRSGFMKAPPPLKCCRLSVIRRVSCRNDQPTLQCRPLHGQRSLSYR